MDAKAAAKRAGRIRRAQEAAVARQRAREDRAAERRLRRDLPSHVRRARAEIAAAVREGGSSCYVHFGEDERGLAGRVADRLVVGGGYTAVVDVEERDMGDSAAPCRVTCVGLRVSWGRDPC